MIEKFSVPDKFTYGYNLGWNVENEYINSIKSIMDGYNAQADVLNNISSSGELIDADVIRNNQQISDEQIREWYMEDYEARGKLISFEKYRADILNSIAEKNQQLIQNNYDNKYHYLANLYHMINIKEKSIKEVNAKKKEFGLLLEEKNIELRTILLETEKNKLEYDSNGVLIPSVTRAELRKRYDETFLEIKKLEHALVILDNMSKLLEFTEEERRLQLSGLNIPKVKEIYDEINRPVLNPDPEIDPEDPEIDPEDPEIDPEDPEIDPEDSEIDPEDPEIDPEDPEIDPEDPEIDPEDPEIDPEDPEIDPEDPEIDPEDIDKPLNLVEILTRIKGEENYSKMDGFVEKYKGIKVINYHRFRARTVLDKPLKLIGTAFSSVVVGTGKLFANMAYKFSSKRRARLDAMVQRVNQLSIEEIDFLMENLTTANLVQYQTLMPNAVFHALQNRFSSRRAQLMEEANKYIELMFQKLVEMYNEAKRIQEQLATANLSEDDKINLRARYDNLLINMVNAKEQIEQARKVDFIANDGSLSDERNLVKENTIGGINSKLKQTISVDRLQRTIALIDKYGRENLMNIVEMFLYNEKVNIENTKHKRTLRNWFGETSVGSREWRPLIEQFDYVKHDYVGSVVRTALIVVSICNVINQMNLQNQVAQLQQELKVANQKIAYLNGEVARLQGIINTCAGDPAKMVATYSEYLKQQAALYQATCDYYGATAQAAYNGLGTPDMTTADPSGIYANIDNMGHTYSSNWIDAINNAQNLPVDQQLKALQAVEEQMQKACVELANKTGNDVMNYVSYKQGFDFSALTSFYSSVGSIDPGFVGEALEKLINLSYATGNVQAIQLINTYNVNVGTAGLVANLALILGESAMHIMDENSKETPEKTDIEERKKQLKALLDTAKIDVHEEARRRFDDANTAWEQQHWFYRFTHKKEKPQLVDFEQEVMDEEISRGRFY